jgi:hypothetical protein
MRVHVSIKTRFKRRIALVLAFALAVQSVSCGTLIHPGRCGQPNSGVLDPEVVILDGLGVLVFVVPGVVAFVVDFADGAIYLPAPRGNPYFPPPGAYPPPPGAYAPPPGAYPPPPGGPPPAGYGPPPAAYGPPPAAAASDATVRGCSRELRRINADQSSLTKDRIAAIVSAYTGRRVQLDTPDVRVIRANNLEDASATLHNVESPPAP